jgi:hypothetical protein
VSSKRVKIPNSKSGFPQMKNSCVSGLKLRSSSEALSLIWPPPPDILSIKKNVYQALSSLPENAPLFAKEASLSS